MKWLIKVSNYLHDGDSLPSGEGICISSLPGPGSPELSRRPRAAWPLVPDTLPHVQSSSSARTCHSPSSTALVDIDSTADRRGPETYKAVVSYFVEWRVCVYTCVRVSCMSVWWGQASHFIGPVGKAIRSSSSNWNYLLLSPEPNFKVQYFLLCFLMRWSCVLHT